MSKNQKKDTYGNNGKNILIKWEKKKNGRVQRAEEINTRGTNIQQHTWRGAEAGSLYG